MSGVTDPIDGTPPHKKMREGSHVSSYSPSTPTGNVHIDRAKKEKQQVDWARIQKMDTVVLNTEKTNITSISGIPLKSWTGKMLPAFCRENGIAIPEKQKTRGDCVQFIINHKNGKSYRDKVSDPLRQKKNGKRTSASTRPHAAPKDGTLLRIILTLTHPDGRSVYIQTNEKLERSELNRRTGHVDKWKVLLDLYKDTTKTELDTMDTDLSMYGYSKEEPADFNRDLTEESFSQVVRFMNYWYGHARNNKNTSEKHLDFESFVNRRGWLVFYHNKLKELGDTELMNASYASLPIDVFATSDGSRCPSEVTNSIKSVLPTSATNRTAKSEAAAEAIMEKNKELVSLTKIQSLKAEADLKDFQDKLYEETDCLIYKLKENLVKVIEDIETEKSNEASLTRYKHHIKKKLKRAVRKLAELEKLRPVVHETDSDTDSETEDIYK